MAQIVPPYQALGSARPYSSAATYVAGPVSPYAAPAQYAATYTAPQVSAPIQAPAPSSQIMLPVAVQRQPVTRAPVPWGTSTRLFSHPRAVPQTFTPPPPKTILQDPGAADPAAENIPQGEVRVYSLSPQVFLPPNGRKKALVLGLSYRASGGAGGYGSRLAQLTGPELDAQNISQYLFQQGFPAQNINLLTDDTPMKPTRSGALNGMAWLVQGAQAGDVLFFYFSGHGGQMRGYNPYEADSRDECIQLLDGKIKDDELYAALVKTLPAGVRMTVLMDCCSSGTGMDLPFHYYPKRGVWTRDRHPNYSRADVRMIGGCEDSKSSYDSQKGGLLTLAYLQAAQSPISHDQMYRHLDDTLYLRMDSRLPQESKPQRPAYSSTHRFDVNTPWDVDSILLDQSQNRNYQYIAPRAPMPKQPKRKAEYNPYDPYGGPPAQQKPCSIM